MTSAIGVVGSIVGIVAFGLQLGVTLQTYVEAAAEASDRLQEIAFEINSTAAVLSQLKEVLKKDCDAAVPIFNIDGVQDMKRLSDRCKRIYSVVIILLNEAVEGPENRKEKRELSADSFDNPSLKLNKLSFRRKLAWPWLEPRIKRCQQELRQVKLDLFLHIQVANLAQFQLNHRTRAPGSFEEEQALKELAQEIMKKRANHAKHLMRRQTEKVDKAMAPAPPTMLGTMAAPPGGTISGSEQLEVPSLLATMTQKTQPGQDTENDIYKPLVDPSLEKDGELRLETRKTESKEDKKMVEVAAPPRNHNQETPLNIRLPIPPHHINSVRIGAFQTNQSSDSSLADEQGSSGRTTSAASSSQMCQSSLRLISTWAHGIFSRGRSGGRYGDRESDELEAWLLQRTVGTGTESKWTLTKLDMGHRQLEAALSTIMPRRWKRGRPHLWEQYKALGPRLRQEIHSAVTEAKQWTNQSRTLIAIDFMQQPVTDWQDGTHAVLFFRLGEGVEPVSLQAGGRKFTLPYEHCCTWEMMKKILVQAFTDTLWDDEVRNDKYVIANANTGAIIPPVTWRSAILPGMDLKVHMWPPFEQGLSRLPRYGHAPPPLPPGVQGCWMPGVDMRAPQRPSPTIINVQSSPTTTDSESTTSGGKHELEEEMEGLLAAEEGVTDDIDTSKLDLGELIKRWTNVPDASGNNM